MSISNWFSSEREEAEETCLTLLLAQAWHCFKDLHTRWQRSEWSFYPEGLLHLNPSCVHQGTVTGRPKQQLLIIPSALLQTLLTYCDKKARADLQAQFLEEFSSDPKEKRRETCPKGWFTCSFLLFLFCLLFEILQFPNGVRSRDSYPWDLG